MPVPVQNGLGKGFQRLLFADVPDVVLARRNIDDLHRRALGPEGFGNRFPDAVRAARDDGDFSCKGWVHGFCSPSAVMNGGVKAGSLQSGC